MTTTQKFKLDRPCVPCGGEGSFGEDWSAVACKPCHGTGTVSAASEEICVAMGDVWMECPDHLVPHCYPECVDGEVRLFPTLVRECPCIKEWAASHPELYLSCEECVDVAKHSRKCYCHGTNVVPVEPHLETLIAAMENSYWKASYTTGVGWYFFPKGTNASFDRWSATHDLYPWRAAFKAQEKLLEVQG